MGAFTIVSYGIYSVQLKTAFNKMETSNSAVEAEIERLNFDLLKKEWLDSTEKKVRESSSLLRRELSVVIFGEVDNSHLTSPNNSSNEQLNSDKNIGFGTKGRLL